MGERGLRIGYLPQEPELDPKKNVYENIMDGLAESTQLLDAFDAISAKRGEPDADFDTLLDQQADLQAKIDHLDCWNLSHEVERAKFCPVENADCVVCCWKNQKDGTS